MWYTVHCAAHKQCAFSIRNLYRFSRFLKVCNKRSFARPKSSYAVHRPFLHRLSLFWLTTQAGICWCSPARLHGIITQVSITFTVVEIFWLRTSVGSFKKRYIYIDTQVFWNRCLSESDCTVLDPQPGWWVDNGTSNLPLYPPFSRVLRHDQAGCYTSHDSLCVTGHFLTFASQPNPGHQFDVIAPWLSPILGNKLHTGIKVGTATRLWDEKPSKRVSIPGKGKRYFSSQTSPDRLWSPSSLLFTKYQGSFLVECGLGCKVHHLHQILLRLCAFVAWKEKLLSRSVIDKSKALPVGGLG
jgi:hypothetical protein